MLRSVVLILSLIGCAMCLAVWSGMLGFHLIIPSAKMGVDFTNQNTIIWKPAEQIGTCHAWGVAGPELIYGPAEPRVCYSAYAAIHFFPSYPTQDARAPWHVDSTSISLSIYTGYPAVILGLIGFSILVYPSLRRHHRHRQGLCPNCGYNLSGLVGRCPECGVCAQ